MKRAVVAVALLVAACTSSAGRHQAGPPLGKAGCAPASPIHGNEVHGTSANASLYGLLMPSGPLPVHARESVKIVWRMTGHGPLHLTATDPAGARVPLQWGPDPHGGSNYNRPGQEWGAGYHFVAAGCWQLHAARGTATADVWLRVTS